MNNKDLHKNRKDAEIRLFILEKKDKLTIKEKADLWYMRMQKWFCDFYIRQKEKELWL